MSALSRDAVMAMGFASVGENVRISDRASFHGASRIALGDCVRIDDFCVLSAGNGGIAIGHNVHVAVYSSMIGAGKISLADFSSLSPRVSVFSSSDDFSGETMTNPTVSDEFKKVLHADVNIGKHVIVGCGSVILPGVTLEEGVAVGVLSLIRNDCAAFGVYAGVPAKRIGERRRTLLEMERRFMRSIVRSP